MKNAFLKSFFAVLLALLPACTPASMFFYPNRVLYMDPKDSHISYAMNKVESANGKNLIALVFETSDPPKGIVVHFHGNFGNVSNHFTQSYFLVKHGYDVVMFDYQGFGGSEGKPSPKGIIEDGQAIVRFASEINRNPAGGVGVFGQSIGGAAAIVVAAKEPLVKAVVIEATFTSYRSIARHATGGSFLLWPAYPIFPLFLPNKYDPIRFVDKIAPRPILFIHGNHDQIIPVKMSKQLMEKAKEPKELWIVDGADHLGCRRASGDVYEKKIVAFFDKAMVSSSGEAK